MHKRTYLYIWIGSLISNMGSWMQNVGQGWLVANLTHSPLQVSLISVAQFLPVLIFAIPAGIWADRGDSRKQLVWAQVFMALSALSLGLATHLHIVTPILIIAFAFIGGSAWAINVPAWHSLLPRLVPRKDLEHTIALHSIQYNLSSLAGPTLAGFIVASIGAAYAFDINAISFLGVIISVGLARVQLPPKSTVKEPKPFAEAFKWVFSHKGAKSIMIYVSAFGILSASIQGLMPIFASDVLKVDAKALGLLFASFSAGSIVGAVLLKRIQKFFPKSKLIPMSILTVGLCEILYSQAPNVYAAWAILFFLGMAFLMTIVSCNSAVQMLLPHAIRGRVMSVFFVAGQGALPIGHLIGGTLAKFWSVRGTYLVMGSLLMVFGIIALLKHTVEIDGINEEHAHS